MAYARALLMYVVNNTGGNAVFAFSHRYGDCLPQIWRGAAPVAPGGFAGPLSVGFDSGLLHPSEDYWYCEARVLDGPNEGMYHTEGSLDRPGKACRASAVDDGMIYYFPFSCQAFAVPLLSGPCCTTVGRS